LTNTLLLNLPTTRTIQDLVNLTPGVVADVPMGASATSIATTFDGTPGSLTASGTPNVYPMYHAIDEIQVIGNGAGAEYGEFTGVQANVIVKAGSNRTSGLGEFRIRRPNWIGDNRETLPLNLRERFRPQELLTDWDLSATVGGPILRDKVWYFAGAQKIVEDLRPAGWTNVPRTPDETVSSLDEGGVIGRATVALSPGIRLEGVYQRNSHHEADFNAGPFVADEALGMLEDIQHVWNVRMLWTPSSRTFVTVMHGGYVQDYFEGPTPPASPAGPALATIYRPS